MKNRKCVVVPVPQRANMGNSRSLRLTEGGEIDLSRALAFYRRCGPVTMATSTPTTTGGLCTSQFKMAPYRLSNGIRKGWRMMLPKALSFREKLFHTERTVCRRKLRSRAGAWKTTGEISAGHFLLEFHSADACLRAGIV